MRILKEHMKHYLWGEERRVRKSLNVRITSEMAVSVNHFHEAKHFAAYNLNKVSHQFVQNKLAVHIYTN